MSPPPPPVALNLLCDAPIPSCADPDKIKAESKQISVSQAMEESRRGMGVVGFEKSGVRDSKSFGKSSWGASTSQRFPEPKSEFARLRKQ